jgi:hypothetical protein
MITKKTFPTIIVPIIAPTCRYVARPLNRCEVPHAASVISASSSVASTSGNDPSTRHSAS